MRKNIKLAVVTVLVASSLLTTSIATTGCGKKEKTDVNTTNTTQEFVNSETNYHKYWWDSKEDLLTNLEKAKALGVGTLEGELYTGHKVYLDKNSKPFIISGDVAVFLETNGEDLWKLPDVSKANLRMEETGQVIKHYKDPAEQEKEIKEFQKVEGNVVINSFKKVEIKELFKNSVYYWEAEKICKETGIVYTEDKDSITMQYETASGKILNYEIPVDNKKKATFEVAVPKGLYNCAIKDDGIVMIDSHILRELMGFEVILNGESSVKQPHIVNTDTADIFKAVFAVDYKMDLTPKEEEKPKSPVDNSWTDEKENASQKQEAKKPSVPKDNNGDGWINVDGYKCKPNSTWNGDVYDPSTGRCPKLGEEKTVQADYISHVEGSQGLVLRWTKGIGWGAVDTSPSGDMSGYSY